MLSWLILIVGAVLAMALVVPHARDASAGTWVGAFAVVGVALWLSGELRESTPEVAPSAEGTTSVPVSGALRRPSPFLENGSSGAAASVGVPMTPDTAP
ncbi:hypothetical protein [Ancylobacter sp. G4_0304]|uniref:hypothetical protein n=1 Tax=Ancylobacter sp. G4_0304 TaxID=3114289 RepID=UPI0039C67D14